MFVYLAGARAVLSVLGPSDSNAGLIHLEARNAAQSIGQLL
jgi:predicted regulator of Ras-like GTPase activity (Roadblock/LC7/MglB family)